MCAGMRRHPAACPDHKLPEWWCKTMLVRARRQHPGRWPCQVLYACTGGETQSRTFVSQVLSPASRRMLRVLRWCCQMGDGCCRCDERDVPDVEQCVGRARQCAGQRDGPMRSVPSSPTHTTLSLTPQVSPSLHSPASPRAKMSISYKNIDVARRLSIASGDSAMPDRRWSGIQIAQWWDWGGWY